ncbi:MAG: DMT family transporter [Kiloniellales bacterium]|nr:DMT family transporter [Kiloniellales bacterium]
MSAALLAPSSRNAKIAVALAAAIWGLYWIPLRGLDEAGVTGAWATLLFYVLPALIFAPVAARRRRSLAAGGRGLLLTAFLPALALVFYANSLIFTEIVRAVLLVYMTPVWSTLFARVFLGEPITRLRLVSIALGFAGLFTILGLGEGLPLPSNLGDWLALLAGVLWGLAAVRLRIDRQSEAEEITFLYFVLGSLVALATCALPDGRSGPMPSPETVLAVLPWLVPVLLLIVIPSSYLALWGTRLLSPGLVGLLFMTEISVGAGSAALLTDEPFGTREILGIVLISTAGLLEAVVPSPVESAPGAS